MRITLASCPLKLLNIVCFSFSPDIDCTVSLGEALLDEVASEFLSSLYEQLTHPSEATARAATVQSHAILCELSANGTRSPLLTMFLMFLCGEGLAPESVHMAEASAVVSPGVPPAPEAGFSTPQVRAP